MQICFRTPPDNPEPKPRASKKQPIGRIRFICPYNIRFCREQTVDTSFDLYLYKVILIIMKKLFILALSLGAFSAAQAQNVDAAGNEIKSNSNQSGQPTITTSTGTQTPAVTPAVTPATPAAKPACAGSNAGTGEMKSCCKAKTASAAGAPACAGAGNAAAGQAKACCKDKAAGDAAASAQKPACNKPCTGHAGAPAQPATTPVQPNNQ